MTKKKRTVVSLYDLEGEMIDVVMRLQEILAKLQSEGYRSNTIKYVPEDEFEYGMYVIESRPDSN